MTCAPFSIDAHQYFFCSRVRHPSIPWSSTNLSLISRLTFYMHPSMACSAHSSVPGSSRISLAQKIGFFCVAVIVSIWTPKGFIFCKQGVRRPHIPLPSPRAAWPPMHLSQGAVALEMSPRPPDEISEGPSMVISIAASSMISCGSTKRPLWPLSLPRVATQFLQKESPVQVMTLQAVRYIAHGFHAK